jgi:hypothetical protein
MPEPDYVTWPIQDLAASFHNIQFHLPSHFAFITSAALPGRVTRLGNLSPIGRLVTLGSLLENCRSTPNFGYFFHSKSYLLLFGKNGLGNILCFFHKPIYLVTLLLSVPIRVARSYCMIPKPEKMYQMNTKSIKW